MPKKLQRRISAPKAAPATTPKRSGGGSGGSGPLSFGKNRVTAKVLAEFTSQLAVLLNAGIPITKSLRILEGQMQQGAMGAPYPSSANAPHPDADASGWIPT